MKTSMAFLLAVAVALGACSEDADRSEGCPEGLVITTGPDAICVVDTRVIVETGFLCAEEYPQRYDRPPYIACGPEGLDASTIDAAIEAFEEATGATSGTADAGGADAGTDSDAGRDDGGTDAARVDSDRSDVSNNGDGLPQPAPCDTDDDCPTTETCASGLCLACTDSDDDGWCEERGDCEDGEPDINPGASDPASRGDGVDNDCDGMIDEER